MSTLKTFHGWNGTPFPSDQEKPIVEVFYQKGDDPFVCGLNGSTNGGMGMIDEIEKDMIDNKEDAFPHGDGQYLYIATWEPAQTGEYGRIELPGYWDLDLIAFKPVEPPIES